MTRQSTSVYNQIREQIIRGELAPASNLKEQELAEQFDASRNTIKKVLLMLEKEGLVTIELNKGAKVRSYSMEEVLEFLDLRSTLEGFIIRRAVPVISEEYIKQLEDILSIMEKHYENKELVLYSKENQKFHNIIYEACPNKTSVKLTVSLKNQMAKYNTKTILVPGRNTQSLQEHSAILMAVKARDSELAEILMRRHIDNVRKTFSENYSLLF